MLPLIKVLSSLECSWFKNCFKFSLRGFVRVLVHWKIGVFNVFSYYLFKLWFKSTTQCAKVFLCWTYPGVLWSQRKICVDQHFRGGSLWGRVCCRKADPQNVAPKHEVGSSQNAATYPNASHLVLPIAGDCRTSWTKAPPLDKPSTSSVVFCGPAHMDRTSSAMSQGSPALLLALLLLKNIGKPFAKQLGRVHRGGSIHSTSIKDSTCLYRCRAATCLSNYIRSAFLTFFKGAFVDL